MASLARLFLTVFTAHHFTNFFHSATKMATMEKTAQRSRTWCVGCKKVEQQAPTPNTHSTSLSNGVRFFFV